MIKDRKPYFELIFHISKFYSICLPFFHSAAAIQMTPSGDVFCTTRIANNALGVPLHLKHASGYRTQMSWQPISLVYPMLLINQLSLSLFRNGSNIKKQSNQICGWHYSVLFRFSPWSSRSSLKHFPKLVCAILASFLHQPSTLLFFPQKHYHRPIP